jgi:hypothetical protein
MDPEKEHSEKRNIMSAVLAGAGQQPQHVHKRRAAATEPQTTQQPLHTRGVHML